MRWKLLAATAAIALACGMPPPAEAATILTFGQSGSGSTITATGGLTGSTFSGTDIPVTITQILASPPLATPISAFFDVSAANTSGAVSVGGLIGQNYAGTFSFNALANGTGTNYLSGTFSDGAITADGSTAIAVFADEALFASDVITTLDLPRSLSLGFTDVAPPVSLTACTISATCGTGQTLAAYTASVAGNASANVVGVPEPSTLALLGAGIFGTGLAIRRRQRRTGGCPHDTDYAAA